MLVGMRTYAPPELANRVLSLVESMPSPFHSCLKHTNLLLVQQRLTIPTRGLLLCETEGVSRADRIRFDVK
jgi:hypothetical protein